MGVSIASKTESGRRFSLPFKTLFIFFILAPLIITSGAIIFFSWRNETLTVDDFAGQLCSELVSNVENRFGAYLETVQAINEMTCLNIRQGLFDPLDLKKLSGYFWAQGNIYPGLGTIGFGNVQGGLAGANEPEKYMAVAGKTLTNGALRRYAPDDEGKITDTLIFEKPGYDARQRSWYQDAVKAGRPIWAGFTVSTSNARIDLTAAAPVYGQDRGLLGVAFVDLPLTQLASFLGRMRIGRTGQIFIVEKDMTLVASSYKELLYLPGEAKSKDVKRLPAHLSRNPKIAGAVSILEHQLPDLARLTRERLFHGTVDGQDHYVFVHPYHFDGLAMTIIAVIPESDFSEHIAENSRLTFLLVGCSLILAVFFCLFAADRISRPLAALSRMAIDIGRGFWPERSLPDTRVREMNDLGQSFFSMATRLQDAMKNLTSEIAEREKIGRLLRESQNRLEKVLETLPLGVWFTDGNGKIVYGNPAARTIWQGARYVEPSEFHEYKGWWKNSGQRILPDEWGVARAIRNKETSMEEEIDIECFDGTRKTILHWAAPVLDAEGDVLGAVAVNQDISERLKMDEQLEIQKRMLDRAQEIAALGSWHLDIKKNVLTWSEEEYKIFGRTKENFSGTYESFLEIVHPDDRAMVDQAYKNAIGNNRPYECVHRIVRMDGVVRIVREKSEDIVNEKGETIHSYGFTQDITEQKHAEDEREKMIETLQKSLDEIRLLRGILPICAYCKNIRNDEGYYEQIESYIHKHSGVDFSHTICPSCMEKHHPDFYGDMNKKEDGE